MNPGEIKLFMCLIKKMFVNVELGIKTCSACHYKEVPTGIDRTLVSHSACGLRPHSGRISNIM